MKLKDAFRESERHQNQTTAAVCEQLQQGCGERDFQESGFRTKQTSERTNGTRQNGIQTQQTTTQRKHVVGSDSNSRLGFQMESHSRKKPKSQAEHCRATKNTFPKTRTIGQVAKGNRRNTTRIGRHAGRQRNMAIL